MTQHYIVLDSVSNEYSGSNAAYSSGLPREKFEKVYFCPIKKNRQVDETDGAEPHCRVDSLSWSEIDQREGKTIHVKKFPKGH